MKKEILFELEIMLEKIYSNCRPLDLVSNIKNIKQLVEEINIETSNPEY